MTQQEAEKAWKRIGADPWYRMNWFVKLANTDVGQLSPGDIRNLQEECQVMRFLDVRFRPWPVNSKRYLFKRFGFSPAAPTDAQLRSICKAVSSCLHSLINEGRTQIGPFSVSHLTEFRKATRPERDAGYPAHLISPMETLSNSSHVCEDELLLRMSVLLEQFVDRIRRCPHCEKVFLQLRRNAVYCGRPCHSVAGMRKVRARKASESIKSRLIEKKRNRRSP